MLYVEDLKVLSKIPTEMTKYKQTIKTFSDEICMNFSLEKREVIHTNIGQIVKSDCVVDIPTLSGDNTYKYLGILECGNILHKVVKETVFKEYLRRLWEILKADFTAKNTVTSIGAFAMPVLR